MTIAKISGGWPQGTFFDEALERFIKDVDDWRGKRNNYSLVPAVDIAEKEDKFLIRAEIPGLGMENVNVEVKDNLLTISGEKADETVDKGLKYHRVERSSGKFERSFYLPRNVDPEKIQANFRNGLLEISVPKREEAKARKIEVAAAK